MIKGKVKIIMKVIRKVRWKSEKINDNPRHIKSNDLNLIHFNGKVRTQEVWTYSTWHLLSSSKYSIGTNDSEKQCA